MKIGFLLQQELGAEAGHGSGPANHIHQVASGLWQLGHDLRLLIRNQEGYSTGKDLKSLEPVIQAEALLAPTKFERLARRIQTELNLPYLNLFESFRFARVISYLMRDRELLFERLSWVGLGGAIAARRMGKPLILEYNGDPLSDLEAKGLAPTGLQRIWSRFLMRRALFWANHIVASGEGWRKQLIRDWKVDACKVTAVPNGTQLVDILDRDSLRAFQANSNELESPHFAYLGGFQPWQGVGILIEAFSRVQQQLPKARLTLVGSGENLESTKTRASQLGLAESVRFTGSLPPTEFAPILAEADIGLSPYCGWEEFEGLKLFDYKAAGMAVIASGKNGEPDCVTEGRTGIILPPCDGEALARAMIELGSESEAYRSMGRQARLDAEKRHSWSKTCQQLETIIHEVLVDRK